MGAIAGAQFRGTTSRQLSPTACVEKGKTNLDAWSQEQTEPSTPTSNAGTPRAANKPQVSKSPGPSHARLRFQTERGLAALIEEAASHAW